VPIPVAYYQALHRFEEAPSPHCRYMFVPRRFHYHRRRYRRYRRYRRRYHHYHCQ
jgi:hypothetical protein